MADLNICLGSTLQINPSGSLALKNKKYGGKVVICNLQPTKYVSKYSITNPLLYRTSIHCPFTVFQDKRADLVINSYVDIVIAKVMKRLGVEIPEYTAEIDPTKAAELDLEWTIPTEQVKEVEKIYNAKVKGTKKRKPFTLDWEVVQLKKAKAEEKKPKKNAA